jgi:hypothetical protein
VDHDKYFEFLLGIPEILVSSVTLSSYFRALVRLLVTTRQTSIKTPRPRRSNLDHYLKSPPIALPRRLPPIQSEVHSFSSSKSASPLKNVFGPPRSAHRPSLRSDPASESPPDLPTLACLLKLASASSTVPRSISQPYISTRLSLHSTASVTNR